jgi:hypothetical protein
MFYLFLGCVSLFSSPRQESFLITNLSSEELIINYEFHEFGNDMRLTINDFDIYIRYTTPDTTWLLRPNRYISIIYYLPVSIMVEDDMGHYYSTYDKLLEIPFSEKARAFFKSFSVYTADGECIIRDIDELCAANIRQYRTGYDLVFFDSGIYLTDEEQEQAINALLWPNGS